jgi:hypothetical protein
MTKAMSFGNDLETSFIFTVVMQKLEEPLLNLIKTTSEQKHPFSFVSILASQPMLLQKQVR